LLQAIADRIGTPAYVYSTNLIRAQYNALDDALHGITHRICYSVKANGNLGVLRVLKQLGAGADIVSVGELRRVLTARFDPDGVVFSGVGKTPVRDRGGDSGERRLHQHRVDERARYADRRREKTCSCRRASAFV
jgi:diaminopimelate decarboxylase